MSIYTASQLHDALSEDVSWRKKELINLKLMHEAARDHQAEMLRRAGIALLYAHWEGYVKAAGTAYVEFVARQNLTYRELTPNFIALGMKAHLAHAAESSRGEILTRVVKFFTAEIARRARLNWDRAVQTRANLSAELLRDIVFSLGLDYRPFEVREKSVVEPLRKRRNSIAHGRHLPVDADEYAHLHNEIVGHEDFSGLLEEFRTQIDNAAQLGTFRASTPSALAN
jgi:MAE_28990/MAE_18760-like HEPN